MFSWTFWLCIELVYATLFGMGIGRGRSTAPGAARGDRGLDLAVHADVIVEARALARPARRRRSPSAEAEYSKQGQAEIDGYPNMAAFLRHRCAITLPESRRLAKRASRIAAWPELGEAWRAGRVTGAQVDLACASIPDRHVARFAETSTRPSPSSPRLTAHATGVVLRRWASHADDARPTRSGRSRDRTGRRWSPSGISPRPRTLDDELVVNGHFDADSAAYIEKALTAATRPDAEGESTNTDPTPGRRARRDLPLVPRGLGQPRRQPAQGTTHDHRRRRRALPGLAPRSRHPHRRRPRSLPRRPPRPR